MDWIPSNIAIYLNKIKKTYEGNKIPKIVFNGINIEIPKNKITCLFGPSGSGKTTLLNILSGLDKNFEGERRIANEFKNAIIGYTFQSDLLLPWRTAYNNARLGLELNGIEDNSIVDKLFTLFGISDFKNNYPGQLSGGMKRRVSIIRSLCIKPKLIFLDEPFSGIDFKIKEIIEEELLKQSIRENQTIIFVTHDPNDAITLSNKVILVADERNINYLDIEFASDVSGRNIRKVRKDKKFTKYREEILDVFKEQQTI